MNINEMTKKAIRINYCAMNINTSWTVNYKNHADIKYGDKNYRTVIWGDGDVRMYAVVAVDAGWVRIGWAIIQHGPGPIIPLNKIGVTYVTADGMYSTVDDDDDDLIEQLRDDWGILWPLDIAAAAISCVVDVDNCVDTFYCGDIYGSRIWGEEYLGCVGDAGEDDVYIAWVDGGYPCGNNAWNTTYYIRHCKGVGQEVTYTILYGDDTWAELEDEKSVEYMEDLAILTNRCFV